MMVAATARKLVDVPPSLAPHSSATGDVAQLPGAILRRLAVVIVPEPGEALASWVDRMAACYETPPGQIAEWLGLQLRQEVRIGSAKPVFYGLALTPQSLRGLMSSTGLSEQQVQALCLSRYDGTALDFSALDLTSELRSVQPRLRLWAQQYSSRACPWCLKESGGVWPLWWRLGIAAACPEHALLLVDICPSCGIRLRRGADSHPRGLSLRYRIELMLCGNRVRGGWCRQELSNLPAVAASGALVDAQKRALDAANGGATTIAGERVEPAEWFAALRVLSTITRFALDSHTAERLLGQELIILDAFEGERRYRDGFVGGGPTTLSTSPPTAELAAAVLLLAEPVLSAPDRAVAATRLSDLMEPYLEKRWRTANNPMSRLTSPAVLEEIMAAVMPARSGVAATAPTASAPGRLEFVHIPWLITVDDYVELIAPHVPNTYPLTGRRFAAHALARLVGAGSWRQAARELGIEARHTGSVADRPSQRIENPELFWEAVAQLANRLVERGLIDYAARRQGLTDLVDVGYDVVNHARTPREYPVTIERRRHSAAWVWAHLTGSDMRHAPAYVIEWNVTRKTLCETRNRFVIRMPKRLEVALIAFGEKILAERGIR